MWQWGVVALAGLTMCSLLFLRSQAADVHDEYSHLVQTSNRYIRELQRTVARTEYLESHYDLPQTSRRRKRSLEPDLNLKTSLLVFCDSLTHPGKYSVPGSKDSKKPEKEKEEEKEVVFWQQSDPKPVRLEVSRTEDSITVRFTVNATFPFQATRASPLWESNDDAIENEVIVPTSIHGTPVSFTFPDTRCRNDNDDEQEFHFTQASKTAVDRLFLYLDVCQLKSKENSNGSLEYVPMSQDNIPLPRFDVPQAEKEIVIIPGRNTSIDVEVDLRYAQFIISAYLYNSRTKTTVITGIRVGVSDSRLETKPLEKTEPGYLQLEEIMENKENKEEGTSGPHEANTTVPPSSDENERKNLRITFPTASGDLSGIVMPLLFKYHYELDNRIVDRTAEIKMLALQKHNENRPFPLGTFFFTSLPKTSCMWEGQDNYDGKLCRVGCYVIGQDITSLTLTKKGDGCFSQRDSSPRLKNLHTYLQSTAVLNLGSSGHHVQGEYLCKVKDKHGNTKEQTIQVVLGGRARLNYTASRIDKLENGTSVLTCVGYGALPLTTEIVLKEGKKKTRIDEHAVTKVDEDFYRITTRVYVASDSITRKSRVQCTLRSAIGTTRITLRR